MAANYSLSCSASALPLQRYLDIDLVAMPTSKRHFLRPGNFGQCESCVWLHTVVQPIATNASDLGAKWA